jgi:1-deoxy-D-xylulose-5-phosphate synthase
MGVLEHVNTPRDLADLTPEQLDELAAEIRKTIIETCAANGGHVGASLGAVELILALHRVFSDPEDVIIFDVGHQAYAHKLVTGRRDRFSTLRKRGGLSGFPRRDESPYDFYGTAHASTGISAALGYAKARDLKGGRGAVAVLVGDGALTGGLAFEALNNAGMLRTDLVVLLNDNSMSISPNVGAISAYLTRLRTAPGYRQLKRDLEAVLRAIPVLGPGTARAVERLKDALRNAVVPGAFFEALGFRYLGPIDGHDRALVEDILRRAKAMGGPVVVHAVTEKGRGFAPARTARDRFHGGGPFDPATGRPLGKGSGRPSWSEAFGQIAVRLAREDPRVVAITAAMEDGTGLGAFHAALPQRFFDVGIAENHAVTFACGLAAAGMRPIVAIYSTFLQRAYDILIHDVAIQRLPVLLCLDRAGIAGEDGQTHHGAFDLAYLRLIPEMTVAAPRDAAVLRDLMYAAVHSDGPWALRYPKGTIPDVPFDGPPRHVEVGRGEILRPGRHVALLAVGSMVPVALRAAELLEAQGVDALVADAVFVKPLDQGLVVHAAQETQAVVTLEEGTVVGGYGDAVAACLGQHGLGAVPHLRLGLPDAFVPHGERGELLAECGLDAASVARRVREWMGSGWGPQAGPSVREMPGVRSATPVADHAGTPTA